MYSKMLSKKIPFIPLVLAFLFQTSWSYADDPKQDFIKGTRCLQQNNVDCAIGSFNSAFRALSDIPNRNEEQNKLLADTLNNRGIAYMEKARAAGSQNRDYDLAEKDFQVFSLITPRPATILVSCTMNREDMKRQSMLMKRL